MSKRQLTSLFVPSRRPRRRIRRRIIVHNIVTLVAILVAGALVIAQVNRLLQAVDTLREANEHVAVVSEVRHRTVELFATVSRLLPLEDSEVFVTEVTAATDALRESQKALVTLTGQTMDPNVARLLRSVDARVTNVINISNAIVRQADAEQWPSVRVRIGVLNRDQQQVVLEVNNLFNVVEETQVAAISQIASIQRAVLLYPAIVIVALFIGAFFFSRNLILSVTVPVERLMVGATRLASGALEERVTVRSDDEMGQLARAFNSMAEQLETYYGELEERVAERTRALRTSIEVSHRVTTITEREALTREVVEQVRSAFDFYHVHIYLFDEKRENLVMAGGTGEAGRAMLAGGHQLALGQGLVGRTAQKNEVTLVPDTAQDPDWLPNPLLPDTRAEVAVPIAFGGEVLGVLDVQQDEVGSLDEANAELLQSIAAQVAVALQNIRLLEQAQLRAEQAALVNTINQKIQQATTVEDVLRTAAQELGQALGVENARVQLQVADIETNGDGFAS